jgi:DNA modification methylase
MTTYQPVLPLFDEINTHSPSAPQTYHEKLIRLLSEDLNFQNQNGSYASHDIHSFPAKYPPQLPNKFISELTCPGDIVLDPMAGSGTTVLEAFLYGRRGIGFDIDPLALLISQVKVAPLDIGQVSQTGNMILVRASSGLKEKREQLTQILEKRWDPKTKEFVDYWFAQETQIELMALLTEIEKISDPTIKAFFQLVFSAIIITKSGGVSLAFDLAHTRPHRVKVVLSKNGEILLGQEFKDSPSPRIDFLTKTLRSPIEEFAKRFKQNLQSLKSRNLLPPQTDYYPASINRGNAQYLPLHEASIDLIVTSPPYASNAIDYMRAHKFSLVWLGYPIEALGERRKKYIGGESITDTAFEDLPKSTQEVVTDFSNLDKKKGRVLHRYYSEMTRTLREIFRVLKPGRAAIVVVGNSVFRGKDTKVPVCLADIGQSIGFEVPKIGIRNLDRNRRMLPAGFEVNSDSQIQQRMHEEYIIGFYKPE